MILGLTGTYASGKDTVAEYLETKGYIHFSLSDFLREICKQQGKEITRDNLIKLGNELRTNFGPGILAYKALGKIEPGKNYIITSIRNSEEAKVITSNKESHLICVTSDINTRFERIKARNRENDPITFEEFVAKENSEKNSDPNAQQLHIVNNMAEYEIKNDTTLEALKTKIDLLLNVTLKPKYERISWDNYFMEITRQVAKRATCDRGRSGSIIVKDKRLLTTGYVGSPIGLEHCDEVGHYFKITYDKDGNQKRNCIRTTHAEQNAIIQAARLGISIEGATIYCRMEPCDVCAKLIINSGIKRVVCENRYHDSDFSRKMLKTAGIIVEVLNDELEDYKI